MSAGQFVLAVGGEQQQAGLLELAREIAQQVEARRIGPVQIVEEEDERSLRRDGCEEVVDLHEEGIAAGDRPFAVELRQERRGRRQIGRGRIVAEEIEPGAVRRRLGES